MQMRRDIILKVKFSELEKTRARTKYEPMQKARKAGKKQRSIYWCCLQSGPKERWGHLSLMTIKFPNGFLESAIRCR